jgi:hypothetical protein
VDIAREGRFEDEAAFELAEKEAASRNGKERARLRLEELETAQAYVDTIDRAVAASSVGARDPARTMLRQRWRDAEARQTAELAGARARSKSSSRSGR